MTSCLFVCQGSWGLVLAGRLQGGSKRCVVRGDREEWLWEVGEELGDLVYLVEAGGELVWEEHEGRLGLGEVEQGVGLGLVLQESV